MTTVTLNNGVEMPILGFGVFQVGPDETEAAVSAALSAGYRLLDTAAAYGNEEAVGSAIAASGVDREELFITTKLWIQDSPAEHNTTRAFDDSLRKLGLDYVDLYLIHQPFGDYYGQWRAMEKINQEGRARAIGVSNFPSDRVIDLKLNSEVAPAVNQIETNPFHQRATDQETLKAEGVQIESWGPFAEGKNGLFSNELLTTIGAAYGKSVAQVVLRWLIQREVVVIPKTVSPERMAQNLAVFDFTLTDEDMARIATLDVGDSQFFDHRDPEMVRWLSARRLDN
ncbi:Aldo/keto reductase [Microbacterium pygmaeum]|uniref:Aldo/keto reductase n=1 Tax=Microbacterium pygmaeum TaxID=370764 RepID=A0A1G7X950_9MICO|nr:aldo/keto reductase [Microbacterium pygmaeum]SDG80090.1 Aldo/keto reductase [Microbacterium pygmaeum]